MKNPYDYINQNPERCQRMFGIAYPEFNDLIAVMVSKQADQKSQASPTKVRINAPGGGCPPKLSEAEEVSLCLLYLRQYPTFEMLGLHYSVCESTAHDIYHRWVRRLRHHLPSSGSWPLLILVAKYSLMYDWTLIKNSVGWSDINSIRGAKSH